MNAPKSAPSSASTAFRDALKVIEQTIDKYRGCTPQEKDRLRHELTQLQEMQQKLTEGRVEMVLFGEISAGKSALINALAGRQIGRASCRERV